MWNAASPRVLLALAVGLVLLAVGVAATLSGAPLTVARTGVVIGEDEFASFTNEAEICQSGEVLPARTSDVRLGLLSTAGPHLAFAAYAGGHLLTSGTRAPGWSTGAVTIAVKPLAQTHFPVRICVHLNRNPDGTSLYGVRTHSTIAAVAGGQALSGRIGIEYLRPADHSWWSAMTAVARRMGLGRSPGGTWTVLLLAMVAASAIAVALGLAAAELR